MGSRLYLVILGQYTYMYKVYLVMVHSYQVVHMDKMNRYNIYIYISIFIYGDETLNIYIYVGVDIYYYTYGHTLGSQGTKSIDLVWTIIYARKYTVQ
jgi:hypothetical protein